MVKASCQLHSCDVHFLRKSRVMRLSWMLKNGCQRLNLKLRLQQSYFSILSELNGDPSVTVDLHLIFSDVSAFGSDLFNINGRLQSAIVFPGLLLIHASDALFTNFRRSIIN